MTTPSPTMDRIRPWITPTLFIVVVVLALLEPASLFLTWPAAALACGLRPLWDKGFPAQGSRTDQARRFFTEFGPRQIVVALAAVLVGVLCAIRNDLYADFALLFAIIALPAAAVAYLLGWAIAERSIRTRAVDPSPHVGQ